MADINFDAGTISEALNRKVDLPTNPERAQDQIDYVVDFQAPTASNNYTWYRKFKSGWVEQGGTITIARQNANTNLVTNVTLPVAMADSNYQVAALCFITDGGNTTGLRNVANVRETTVLRVATFSTSNISNAYTAQWRVEGMAA